MFKRIAFFMASCFIVLTANAQLRITGTVSDESGNPLIGANVQISNSLAGTATDSGGRFILPGLKPEAYLLKFSYMGYEAKEVPVKLDSSVNLTIILNAVSIMSEEVTVHALRAGENTPVSYSTVTREEISRSNRIQDVPYLLAMTPSVTVTSDAGIGVGYSGIRIRGTDPTRINVTVNGIPLNDSESHEVYWVDIPDILSSAESVQIQRGVGTSTQGAAAFGANINLQTTKINTRPFADINLVGGSFNTWKTCLATGTGMINKHWNVDVRLSGIHTDGFIDRAFANLKSGYLSGGYYSKKNIVRFTLMSGYERTYQAWGGVPSELLSTDRTYNPYAYENEVDDYRQEHAQLHWSGLVSSGMDFNVSLFYTRGSGYYEQFREEESFSDYLMDPLIIGGDTINSTDLVRRKWLDNHFFGGIYALNFRKPDLIMTIGGGANQYLGDHFGRVIWSEYSSVSNPDYQYYFNEGNKSDLNQFVKTEYAISNSITLFADLQYRFINYAISGSDDDLRDLNQEHRYHFLNPKAGVTWMISPVHKTYFSYSIAHREPKRSNFTDATPGMEVKPETLRDLEAGYQYNSDKAVLGMTLYWMDYTDQLVLTGQINDVGSPVMVNVTSSYRLGSELSASLMPSSKIRIELNLTLSSNKIRNFTELVDDWDTGVQHQLFLGTTDLSFSPSVLSAGRFSWLITKCLKLSFESHFVSRQYIDNTTDKLRSLDPYWVNNLMLSWSVNPSWCRELSFFGQVNNLLNEKYETNAWVYSYFYEGQRYKMDGYFPQAGIHFFAGVNIGF
ncbi:MAG: TonB-dependent receptor [Bacteroidota bacterium]